MARPRQDRPAWTVDNDDATDSTELPAFAGDVAEDITRTHRLVTGRFYNALTQGRFAFGVPVALVVILIGVIGSAGAVVVPEELRHRPLPLVIGLGVTAVVFGAASGTKVLPGRVRVVLGAVPAACLVAASASGSSFEVDIDADLGVAPLLLMATGFGAAVVYTRVAGLKIIDRAQHRVAELGATTARDDSDPDVS